MFPFFFVKVLRLLKFARLSIYLFFRDLSSVLSTKEWRFGVQLHWIGTDLPSAM